MNLFFGGIGRGGKNDYILGRSGSIIFCSPVCNMLHYSTSLLFTVCQHYNADNFSDDPHFSIVYQFDIAK